MGSRSVEVTLISAKDLQDVNLLSKTKPFAVAWISGDPRSKQKTAADKQGGISPSWNQTLRFTVDEAALQEGRLALEIRIFSEGSFVDKEIGTVSVPLKEFLKDDAASGNKSVEYVSYQVRRPSGKPKGILNMSIKMGEKSAVGYVKQGSYGASSYAAAQSDSKEEPVTAYPAYLPGSSQVRYPPPASYFPPGSSQVPYQAAPYPPPPPHSGYPPQGFVPNPGYPPPNQGYAPQGYPPYGGYPPVVVPPQQQQQPPKRSSGLGLGLGAGLLGGALGGLLIGDMISDGNTDSYEAGYDAGFDNGFGGDF